jgi:hypothetical protein
MKRAAARSATASLSGAFSKQVHGLRDALVRLRMLVEATLDFPEEELDFLQQSDAHGQLERLRAQQQQERAPTARPNPSGAPRQGGGLPTGTAALTQGEIRGLADQVAECWNVDAGMLGLQDITVELRVQLDAQGNVRNVVPAGNMPSDPRVRSVFESARRALLAPACNPLKVPADKMQTVMASTFRFSPRGLVR